MRVKIATFNKQPEANDEVQFGLLLLVEEVEAKYKPDDIGDTSLVTSKQKCFLLPNLLFVWLDTKIRPNIDHLRGVNCIFVTNIRAKMLLSLMF